MPHDLIKILRAKVRAEKNKQGVAFPAHKMVKAAIERHPAKVHENQTDGWLPWQNVAAKNPQTHWRRHGTGALQPEPVPPPPATPPAAHCEKEGVQSPEIKGVPPG